MLFEVSETFDETASDSFIEMFKNKNQKVSQTALSSFNVLL